MCLRSSDKTSCPIEQFENSLKMKDKGREASTPSSDPIPGSIAILNDWTLIGIKKPTEQWTYQILANNSTPLRYLGQISRWIGGCNSTLVIFDSELSNSALTIPA